MAILRDPHWEVVPPLVRDLLSDIGQEPFSRRFYLAGGTALALRLGHRISVDLDFFSETDELWDESRAEIVAALRRRRTVDVVEDVTGNLLLRIEGVYVGFFSYGYVLLEPPEEVMGVRVASLTDVGLMKLDALVDRKVSEAFRVCGGGVTEVRIYTIGHSNVPAEKIISLLKDHGIDILVDVRSQPYSRHSPQFNKESFQRTLSRESIEYAFAGEWLGGRPKDPSCYEDGRVSYEKMEA